MSKAILKRVNITVLVINAFAELSLGVMYYLNLLKIFLQQSASHRLLVEVIHAYIISNLIIILA